ncbi:MAG: T9SS type A sorting domain-containing protein [Candidatus Electryonea clarkiae]|nr:T9SS type A sorting domain-containing protein [Candidatus Electryonea clarkiae]MDP8285735.1 T9SS type A sorting domain-containing protein [Candidatus Electryonea clarkiae]
MYRVFYFILLLTILLSSVHCALSEVVLIPLDDSYPTDYIPIDKISAQIIIQDQMATTFIDQKFDNDWGYGSFDAAYNYPLPERASMTGFGQWINDEISYFELESGDREEPGGGGGEGGNDFLEYLGENPFTITLNDIPDDIFTIRLEYAELMDYSFGEYQLVYPLDMSGFQAGTIDTVEIQVKVSSQRSLNGFTSQNHNLEILYQSSDSLSLRYLNYSAYPDEDISLIIEVDPQESGMWVMAQMDDPDSSGYFLAVLEPGNVQDEEIFQKYFTFVIDASRSMLAQDRIVEAKVAATYCIEHLAVDDYFNVISFNDQVSYWRDDPVLASEVNVSSAVSFIDNLALRNGTDLNAAMIAALEQDWDPDAANQILLVSDGRPEAVRGELHLPTILENIHDANESDVSIFTVGVGDPNGYAGSNLDFLRLIAYQNGGLAISIPPGSNDISDRIAEFFTVFAEPAMIDITLDYGSVNVYDIYPPEPYSIFAGSQTVIAGRYSSFGTTEIEVSGRLAGEDAVFPYGPFSFSNTASDYPFVPRMWAISKIDYWLAYMDVHGEDRDIIEMIVELSLRFGILTPYTTYDTNDVEEDDSELTNFTVTSSITKNGVELEWKADSIPAGSVFNVYRRYIDGTALLLMNDEPLTEPYFVDNNIFPGESYVYRIIVTTPTGQIFTSEVEVKIPEKFEADNFSIFPNPFNNEAKVVFNIETFSAVKIDIYNLLGQKVSSLWEGNSVAGKHVISLNGADIASGTYFVNLNVESLNNGKSFSSLQKIFVTK